MREAVSQEKIINTASNCFFEPESYAGIERERANNELVWQAADILAASDLLRS